MANFKQKIEEILNEARPALQKHHGNVELVEADEASGLVKLRLEGACKSCPMSTFTLQLGIEKLLKERLPEVKNIVDVTEYEIDDEFLFPNDN